jgi:hypothetical protein
MVLQYFSSEKGIFAFNRNPKTFILATILLMLLLRLLTLVLEHADTLWRKVLRIKPTRSTQQNVSGESRGKLHLAYDVFLLLDAHALRCH